MFWVELSTYQKDHPEKTVNESDIVWENVDGIWKQGVNITTGRAGYYRRVDAQEKEVNMEVEVFKEYEEKVAKHRDSLFASTPNTNDPGITDTLKSAAKELRELTNQIKSKIKSLGRRKDTGDDLKHGLQTLADELVIMNNLATHLVMHNASDMDLIECINTHHEWKFARGIVKRAFKCSIITSLKFSDWVAFTNTRQTMIDALDKKDGNEFFCLMVSEVELLSDAVDPLRAFVFHLEKQDFVIDTSLGCTLKSLTIVLNPKAHMPDDIKTAIASLQTKADSMVANADSGLAAVFQGLSQGKALLKQSRDIAEKTSKDMAFLDEASSTLQKLDEFLNDQSDSAFDFTAGLTLAHTTATSLQDMCTKFVSPIQCEYERIIGSRKGHYDKDGCKMINDFNGLIKTLPELKDTTLAELNRFKKTLDPLVQRISKFCDSSQGLIVSVQKDVEAFGKGKGEATAYASHTFTEEKGVSHTPIAVAAAKAFTLPPPHPTESADDHSSDNSSSSDSPRDDASVPKAAPPQRESDTGMTHANNAEGSEPIMKPAVDAKTMTKTSVADILEDATKAGTSSDEVIQNKLEFLNDAEFDGLLADACNHPLLIYYSHHLRSEKIVDDDWEFGHEDGDPYEDLAHFLRWLASYGPDYINAVVNTQDKPDSAMATTQAAKESLETALENIMDIEETTKNIISAEPIATSTLNDFKKNDENPGDQELDKRLKRLDFWALIHCSDLKEGAGDNENWLHMRRGIVESAAQDDFLLPKTDELLMDELERRLKNKSDRERRKAEQIDQDGDASLNTKGAEGFSLPFVGFATLVFEKAMAAQLKEIVDRLNAEPFNLDLSLDPFELMEILKKVLTFLDPKHDVDVREEKPDATYQRISEFLHILGYQCSFDIEFQQGLMSGDKNTIHPILYWLLNNLEALRKRAYLAKFCMNLEVPEEFLREEQVAEVYRSYKELQSQFKATHSHVEQERQGRMNPSDLQREVQQLDAEREQLAQKIQLLKAKTERDEGFAQLLQAKRNIMRSNSGGQ
ncbi:unnamed protein product [Durusdinium trenchii]|uniref:IFT81 calponin homology domain-containing protein n=1 Tax=Durusdinium trenchii TaxID=1381693 RepID=A0ABP0IR31_9DINO